MEPKTRIDDHYMTTDSSKADSGSQNTGLSAWDTPALCLGDRNYQNFEENNACSLTSTATPLPVQRYRAHLDESASGVSYGDEFLPKLSRINGAINKMNPEQMRKKLIEFSLNASGVKEVLRKRLKNYYKRQRMVQCNKVLPEDERMKYDYLVVIDFEATCSETNENFVHEIIEFPAVMVDVKNLSVCNVFQRFCKPRINPILTEFCTTLTGISQSQVDKAKDFVDVLRDFEEWLSLHSLGTEYEFAVLTDGPWDMARFLKTQVELSSIEYPRWGKQWINLRKAYTAFYACGRVNLHQMLEDLGMKFQGRPHCGLDDARNIAEIVVRLLLDGCILRINEHFREGDINTHQCHCAPSGAAGNSSNDTSLTSRTLLALSSDHTGRGGKIEG